MSLLFTAGLTAQETYGTYRYPEIEAPFKEEADHWSDDLLQDLTDSVEILEGELVAMYRLYMKVHTCSPEEMARMEDDLASKNMEVENFKGHALARYFRDQRENDSLVRENLTVVIHQFMKENKLLFLSQHDKVIVCKDCKDYTNELIAHIHRQSTSAATAADQ